jgi:NNP family nitrate/nitrite transporter-like MFS transporter
VIKNTFPEFLGHHTFIATYLAGLGFMGALIGSVARPFGGWVADRMGGARVTLACFVGMGLFTVMAIAGVNAHSFGIFFSAYMVIFFFAGAGNGSTYRMIPAIFSNLGRAEARRTGQEAGALLVGYKRQAAAVIGIAGAIGAFGGFLIQVAFRQSSLEIGALVKAAKTPAEKVAVAQAHQDWSLPALYVFLGAYVVMALVTYARYMRKVEVVEVAPGMTHAAI